ncbi:hypothetical protein PLICRDRAFT_701046 [Plicaturopsis crispa FD-325 SS-3]|nr:hypothetical protein PLICRDRAFT_701046 [Plicaturopsis crispa FD-325 SS-3]
MAPLSNPMTLKRIHREIADVKKEDLGPITLGPTEDSLFVWKGSIPGPKGSCYEGGVFKVNINLAPDYPFSAPKVTFGTRIYHMNISDSGNICIDILKHNWSPALSLFKVMLSLSSLLTDPNPQDPLVPSIATEYVRKREQHDKTARHWTELYAKPQPAAISVVAPIPVAATSAPTARRSQPAPADPVQRPSLVPTITRTSSAPRSRNKGKSRAISPSALSNVSVAATAGSSTASALREDSEPIMIDSDSDAEVTVRKGKGKAANGKDRGRKRKAETPDDGSEAEVMELAGAGRPKRRATGSGSNATGRNMGEVIIIDE